MGRSAVTLYRACEAIARKAASMCGLWCWGARFNAVRAWCTGSDGGPGRALKAARCQSARSAKVAPLERFPCIPQDAL